MTGARPHQRPPTSPPPRPGPLAGALGFPTARHPESLAHELPAPDEAWLGPPAARLRPAASYTHIITGGTP